MKSALKVTSWIATVLGAMSMYDGLLLLSNYPNDAYYSLIGGGMFAAQGILALVFVKSTEKK